VRPSVDRIDTNRIYFMSSPTSLSLSCHLRQRRVQVELEVVHSNLLETIVYLFLLFLVRGRSTFSRNHLTGGPIVGPNGLVPGSQ